MKLGTLAVLGSVLVTLCGCANLSRLEAGECGNGLLEPEAGEDCDSLSDPRCLAAGQLYECKYGCATTADCQAIGWGACAVEGYCARYDICGNGLLEAGEECDDEASTEVGGTCLPQGDEGECRFGCREQLDGSRTACPEGWGCGPGDLCVELDVCGNDATEPGEDCDGSDALDGTCRAPDTEGACRFDCSVVDGQRVACPTGWGCGPGDICVQWEVCGNDLAEPGEDCDGSDALAGATCLGPDEANGCHYDCGPDAQGERPACPSSWGCGPDGLCVELDVCGNGKTEPLVGEECEPDETPDGLACGEPLTPEACRWRCVEPVSDEPVSCPGGWGCGLDGYCRHGAGAFEVASLTAFDEPIDTLHIGDFDGDGRSDLLLQTLSTTWATFVDEQGNLVDAVSMPANPNLAALAAVGRLTSTPTEPDRRDDALLLADGALSVYRGQPDRTLAPTIYTSVRLEGTSTEAEEVAWASVDAMPVACDAVLTNGPADPTRYWGRELVAFVTSVAGDGGTILWPQIFNDEGTDLVAVGNLGAPVSRLTGAPLAVDVLPTPQTNGAGTPPDECGCEDLVYAFAGARELWLLSPCLWSAGPSGTGLRWNDPTSVVAAPVSFTLPDSVAPDDTGICGPMSLYDADGDGSLDIIVGVGSVDCEPGTPSGLRYFAVLTGAAATKGLMVWDYSADDVPDALQLVFHDGANASAENIPFLYALGNLDDDGVPDVATERGVYVSGGGIDLRAVDYFRVDPAALLPPEARYTAAVVADFNRDGLDDVVGRIEGPTTAPTLVVLAAAGGGAVISSVVPTAFEPGSFAVGDYDGDLLLDVAFAEGAAVANLPTDSQLSVAFGTPFGQLEPPVTEGSLRSAESVYAHNLHRRGYDGLSDLVVVSNSPLASVVTNVAILEGNPSRQLTSSYRLDAASMSLHPGVLAYESVAYAGAVGHFTSTSHLDLAVLGESQYKLTYPLTVSWEERSMWLLPATGEATVNPTAVTRLGQLLAPSAAARVPTEGWLLAMNVDADPYDELIALASNDDGSANFGSWWIFDATSPAAGPWVETAKGVLPALLGRNAAASLGRGAWGAAPELFDADADGDSEILTLGTDAATGGSSGIIVVLTSDGTGGLTPQELALPIDPTGELDGTTPLAVAAIEANGQPGDELVVVLGDSWEAGDVGGAVRGVIVARADLAASELVDWSLVELPPIVLEQNVAGLWRLDYDGDGAQDLALLVSGVAGSRVILLRGLPSAP